MKLKLKKFLAIVLLVFLTFKVFPQPVNKVETDSLKHIIQYSTNDSLKAEAAVSLSWYYYKNEPDSVYYYINLAKKFTRHIKNEQRRYKLYSNIAYLYSYIGAFDQAAKYYEKIVEIALLQNDKNLIIHAYGELAQLYSLSENYELSKRTYQKVLSLLDKENDKKASDLIYYNMRLGRVFYYLGKGDSAKYYLDKAIRIYEQNKDKINYSLNDIGAAYFYLGNYLKAIEYFKQAMQEDTTRLRKAIELSNIGEAYYFLKDYKKAENYFKQVVTNPEDTIYLEVMKMSYMYLMQIYEKQGLFKKSYYALKKYNEFLQKKIYNKAKQRSIANLELKLKLSKKNRLDSIRLARKLEAEKQKLLFKKAQARHQLIIILLVIAFLIVSLIYTFFYRKKYILNKKQKESLKIQSEILSKQKFEIELSNQKLKESVEYASKLQKALLPDKKILDKYFSDYFVFFKPRDKMSGDFYWWVEVEDNLILAVGDCTGHGIPGAMISFIGITLLNELVINKKILETDKILNELRSGIIKALHQEKINYKISDGMDIGIIKFNKTESTIYYSGAYISLHIVRKHAAGNKLINVEDGLEKNGITMEQIDEDIIYRIKGDRMPISKSARMYGFTYHGIKVIKGDIIYLFTDGFVDQLGGKNLGRYHRKKFRHFILNMSSLSMQKQKEKLSKELSTWRGEYPQVDDILVVGLKI